MVRTVKAETLLNRIEYTLIHGALDTDIQGLCTDNRVCKAGDAFICIKGARFDTHTCVKQIAEAGAALIVVNTEWADHHGEELSGLTGETAVVSVSDTRLAKAQLAAAWYGHPADHLITIGVTGSKGKTTTTHMLASILQEGGYRVGTVGTNGAIIGQELYELNNTTPDSEELQMYLARMVDAGCQVAVIECSSQGLMQHRVSGFTFDYGIFTNIAEGDHVGPNEHKSFEEYLYCKSLLLRQSKQGIVNADDVHLSALLEGIETPLLFYGEEGSDHRRPLDYEAYKMEKTFDGRDPGLDFCVKGALQGQFQVNLPGLFNVGNALAAIVVAHRMGVSVEAMARALCHLSIKGRIDMVYRSDCFQVCVDFAHNGYSTRNLLLALREYRPKRLICIFGADGNRAKSRRYEMGEASGRLADLSIVTSGHNRYESFEQIFQDISVGLSKTTGEYIVIPNRKEAIRYAIEHVEDGDLITIIGLGHETYQEENGIKYPYSDTEYVKSVIDQVMGEQQNS
jgi:UDP-N-acetylmuramoyl-L-alanyl-D-glutamate--2,6-diaminopimelate ligase